MAEATLAVAGQGSEPVAFGRYFSPNPDLPLKQKANTALTHYDRKTFCYTDYLYADKSVHKDRLSL